MMVQTVDGKQKRLFPVIVPSRDMQGLNGKTTATIWNCLWVMGFEPALIEWSGHGYSFCRTETFKEAVKQLGVPSIRGLLIDADIRMEKQQEFIDAVSYADKYGFNFVAPYRINDGWTTIAHASGRLMQPKDLQRFKSWDRVPKAGLGFYYGDIPLTYKFHELDPHGGEDLNFFHDNPQLDIRIVKTLDLKHLKMRALGLEDELPMGERQIDPDDWKFDDVWFRAIANGNLPKIGVSQEAIP